MSWSQLVRDSNSQHAVAIAPSILSADFSRLEEEVRAVETAGADLHHLDVMDGHFVPNITFGPFIVGAIRKLSDLTLDTHLMIANPDRYIEPFVKDGSDIVTIHVEASTDVRRDLEMIRRALDIPFFRNLIQAAWRVGSDFDRHAPDFNGKPWESGESQASIRSADRFPIADRSRLLQLPLVKGLTSRLLQTAKVLPSFQLLTPNSTKPTPRPCVVGCGSTQGTIGSPSTLVRPRRRCRRPRLHSAGPTLATALRTDRSRAARWPRRAT